MPNKVINILNGVELLIAKICVININYQSKLKRSMDGDVHRLSQTGESTEDWLAFSSFESSSDYNSCEVSRIPDHQHSIIDQVNLNINRVGFS